MPRFVLFLALLALAACEKKSDSGPAGGRPGTRATVSVDAGARPVAAADAAPVPTTDAAPVADAAPAPDAAPAGPPAKKKPAEKINHANPAPDDMPTKKKHECPRMPACGIGCPGPMAKDANGCTLCACEKVKRPGDL